MQKLWSRYIFSWSFCAARLDVRDTIEHPCLFVRRWDEGRVTNRGPHQSPEIVGEACNRVPGGLRRSINPEHKPAVPGKILQLHGANEHWRVKACHRVVGDVFDPGGKDRAEVFALHRVARDSRVASAGKG